MHFATRQFCLKLPIHLLIHQRCHLLPTIPCCLRFNRARINFISFLQTLGVLSSWFHFKTIPSVLGTVFEPWKIYFKKDVEYEFRKIEKWNKVSAKREIRKIDTLLLKVITNRNEAKTKRGNCWNGSSSHDKCV